MPIFAYHLAHKYGLADARAVYNPDVYYNTLDNVERDTLDAITKEA